MISVISSFRTNVSGILFQHNNSSQLFLKNDDLKFTTIKLDLLEKTGLRLWTRPDLWSSAGPKTCFSAPHPSELFFGPKGEKFLGNTFELLAVELVCPTPWVEHEDVPLPPCSLHVCSSSSTGAALLPSTSSRLPEAPPANLGAGDPPQQAVSHQEGSAGQTGSPDGGPAADVLPQLPQNIDDQMSFSAC